MLPASSPFALFDDNLDERGDLLLGAWRETLRCDTPEQVGPCLAAIEAARGAGCWIAVAAHYELGYALEPRLHRLLDGYPGPLLQAWVFEQATRQDAAATSRLLDAAIAAGGPANEPAGLAGLRPEIDATRYRTAVTRIRELIDAGDCYQVNFTFGLDGKAYGDPLALYRRLRTAQPVRYGAFIRDAGCSILSRSPELFVERHGDTLRCKPMKGTAARSEPAARLAASEKNRAENVMIVDLIRNDLGRLAPPGGVRVEALCAVEPYPRLWQMTSTVTAAPVTAGLAEILRALFPCGSITGAPKIRAMEIIRDLEASPRGLYCGALGWLAPDGDFRFNVPIRTLVVDAAGRTRLGLGSGIVADSDPLAEWEECELKGRFATALPPQFGLIETLRCEPGAAAPYPLLDAHLERLQGSAAVLGFRCAVDEIRAALLQRAVDLSGPHRVRLQLEPDGRIALRAAALDPLPRRPRVCIASATVDSTRLLARHKTTVRGVYDEALARATAAGFFDALFFNECDELAEGARSNVFVEIDGELLTPPLASGALAGVYRGQLLRDGRAREARIARAQLMGARRVFLANALRGLFEVELSG